MLNIAGFEYDSIVDGEGVRTVVFLQGCPHHCVGCHNPETWEPLVGKEMLSADIYSKIECTLDSVDGVTFSGGEPFCQAKELLPIAKDLVAIGVNIWCYTGYTYEKLVSEDAAFELLKCIDVLVDGRFEVSKKSLDLMFCGSTNQRVIDVQKSISSGEVVLWKYV